MIVEEARKHLGTPFHHQGRLPGVGLDCVGLLVVVAQSLGIPHEDFTGYARRPHKGSLRHALERNFDLVQEAKTGDVLAFYFLRPGIPHHVAIRTDYGIIHSFATAGKVVETRLGPPLVHQIDSAWRFRQWPQ